MTMPPTPKVALLTMVLTSSSTVTRPTTTETTRPTNSTLIILVLANTELLILVYSIEVL